MTLLLAGLALVVASGALAALLSRHHGAANAAGAFGIATGSALALVPVVGILLGGATLQLDLPWSVPNGRFTLQLDALAAIFLMPMLALAALSAVWGWGKLPGRPWRRGRSWLVFALLVAAMALVFLARNALLFLVAWELMAITSYLLVTWEHDESSVRSAGWIYLLTTHLGTVALIILFAWLGGRAGSYDFADWHAPLGYTTVCFVLALIGFGSKAGFVPFHVWMPEAYPAAPSHVGSLMAGVMSKSGVYGLLRLLPILGVPEASWGWALLAVGLGSALLGVMWALGQGDLKRLLAYSSVENMGIIATAVGLALLARAQGSDELALLALVAALLHVWNHAAFKGLLFFGAGAVQRAAGTLEVDRLGGLLRRMPWTGFAFLVGAAAICALPPLNGFSSELLLYLGAFSGIGHGTGPMVALLAVLIGLSIVGGVALAAFAKGFGITFLGEPRSDAAAAAAEVGWSARLPALLLVLACFGLALGAPWLVWRLAPAAAAVLDLESEAAVALIGPVDTLRHVTWAALALLGLIGLLAGARALLLRGRTVGSGPTWDCGYAKPTARMQYTGSSFAEPLTDRFATIAGRRREETPVHGLFPERAGLRTTFPDRVRRQVYEPAFEWLARGARRLQVLQGGRTQLYVLYVLVTLVVLLVWQLG